MQAFSEWCCLQLRQAPAYATQRKGSSMVITGRGKCTLALKLVPEQDR